MDLYILTNIYSHITPTTIKNVFISPEVPPDSVIVTYSPTPSSWQPWIYFLSLCRVNISMLYKWNHTSRSLLSLSSFTSHSAFGFTVLHVYKLPFIFE